ncbi:MAG TPA: DUF1801 domain-containing protein [Actinomycetota bacterium]|nr:DUF1801 domain-containing protein [Actinomycetota bacterium]
MIELTPAMKKNPEVTAFFRTLEHPLKDAMEQVRTIMLGADSRITEAIKWKSPTFIYEGNIASIEPRSKKHVSVLFHQGAALPGKHPLLEGGGETVRYMRFADLEDVKKHRSHLEATVKAWCFLKDRSG